MVEGDWIYHCSCKITRNMLLELVLVVGAKTFQGSVCSRYSARPSSRPLALGQSVEAGYSRDRSGPSRGTGGYSGRKGSRIGFYNGCFSSHGQSQPGVGVHGLVIYSPEF
ncbi:hypothetical protein V6N13_067462 [Hibiscus sabdariffa]|uniref:Glycine-rich protein n=1 Tax=Hibiscus sabdariffa TaxID=183260 RepID=A0ABR2DTH4_9ROSI